MKKMDSPSKKRSAPPEKERPAKKSAKKPANKPVPDSDQSDSDDEILVCVDNKYYRMKDAPPVHGALPQRNATAAAISIKTEPSDNTQEAEESEGTYPSDAEDDDDFMQLPTTQRLVGKYPEIFSRGATLQCAGGEAVTATHGTKINQDQPTLTAAMLAAQDPCPRDSNGTVMHEKRLSSNASMIHALLNDPDMDPYIMTGAPYMPPVGSVWLCRLPDGGKLHAPSAVDDGLKMKSGWRCEGAYRVGGGRLMRARDKLNGLPPDKHLSRFRTWDPDKPSVQFIEYMGDLLRLPDRKSNAVSSEMKRQYGSVCEKRPMGALAESHSSGGE